MTLWELEKKLTELDDLRAELNAVIAELKGQNEEKPTPPHPRWKPNEREEVYYVISACGDVCFQGWTNDDIDNKRLSCGNIFMTREAAEFAAERRKVLAKMREWAGNYNDAFMLTYDTHRNKVFYVPAGDTWVHGEMRFATEEDAENCIKAVGEERLKKYYFMIPEGADENT